MAAKVAMIKGKEQVMQEEISKFNALRKGKWT